MHRGWMSLKSNKDKREKTNKNLFVEAPLDPNLHSSAGCQLDTKTAYLVLQQKAYSSLALWRCPSTSCPHFLTHKAIRGACPIFQNVVSTLMSRFILMGATKQVESQLSVGNTTISGDTSGVNKDPGGSESRVGDKERRRRKFLRRERFRSVI